MILIAEMIPAIEGPSLARADGWCRWVWRSSLAPSLHHALTSLFVLLAKSMGWSPNDPDGLLVTLRLASNGQQQAQHTDLPLCWEGLKWAAGSSLACSCGPWWQPEVLHAHCSLAMKWPFTETGLLSLDYMKLIIWLPHLGRGKKEQIGRRGVWICKDHSSSP